MIQMKKEICVVYEIIGPGTGVAKDFACAICEAERLLFREGIPVDEIRVTRDIYPAVARQLKKESSAVARQVERYGNLCWETMDDRQKQKYIGKELKDIRAPRDMVFYLAYYVHFEKSFYHVLEKYPSLLFGQKTGHTERTG